MFKSFFEEPTFAPYLFNLKYCLIYIYKYKLKLCIMPMISNKL